MNMINVIVKEPGKAPYLCEMPGPKKIGEQASWIQEKVGGLFETPYFKEGIFIACNEDGKSMNLEPNFFVSELMDIVVGTVIFLGVDKEGNTIGLTSEQVTYIISYFTGAILE